MMPFPFRPFRPFPHLGYYPQYTYYNENNFSRDLQSSNQLPVKPPLTEDENSTFDGNKNKKSRSSKYNNFAHINLDCLFNSDLEHPIVEFMGISLYLDDLIIIGLLFFLYKEDVHDEILFSILLLLLLSQ